MRRALVLLLLLTFTPPALAEPTLDPPPGARLPLDLPATDIASGPTTLGAATGGLPTVLVLADYTCTTLCGTGLGLAAAALPGTGLRAGQDYTLLVIGLDPRDAPADAAAMRDAHLGASTRLAGAARMLVAPAATVAAVEAALGFRAEYRPETDGFDHPLALMVLAPDGRLRAVLPGLRPEPAELRAALAAQGGLVRGITAICRSLGLPGPGSAAVLGMLAVGAAATLAGLGAFLLALHRRRVRDA